MIIIIFGVSGCGKTTVATLLANTLGWMAVDADDYHSEQNKAKMQQGIALKDIDREPWLRRLQGIIADASLNEDNLTLACSALKVAYRNLLKINGSVKLVCLNLEYEEVVARFINRNEQRLKANQEPHFMDISLINSQFEALETFDAIDLALDATLPPETLVQQIIDGLSLTASKG